MIDGGSDADQLVFGMLRAESRQTGLDGGIVFVHSRLGQRRWRKVDWIDFLDGDFPSALLVNLSVEDVPSGDDERGLRRVGQSRP